MSPRRSVKGLTQRLMTDWRVTPIRRAARSRAHHRCLLGFPLPALRRDPVLRVDGRAPNLTRIGYATERNLHSQVIVFAGRKSVARQQDLPSRSRAKIGA